MDLATVTVKFSDREFIHAALSDDRTLIQRQHIADKTQFIRNRLDDLGLELVSVRPTSE
jgi:hypothetical protein